MRQLTTVFPQQVRPRGKACKTVDPGSWAEGMVTLLKPVCIPSNQRLLAMMSWPWGGISWIEIHGRHSRGN